MTESLSDKFRKLSEPGQQGSDTRATKTPEAWQPRMDIDMEKGGYLVSHPRKEGNTPDAEEILTEFNLNADEWRVTGVRKSRWQTYNGEWLEAYRVSVVPADYVASQDFDLEKLFEEMQKWRPEKYAGKTSGEGAFIVAPSDQQIGKKANGEGNPFFGKKHSAESLEKISRASSGKNNPNYGSKFKSEEYIKKQSDSNSKVPIKLVNSYTQEVHEFKNSKEAALFCGANPSDVRTCKISGHRVKRIYFVL
jgi:hypothetical protein